MTNRTFDNKFAALSIATVLLIINFWAWSLLAPLGPVYAATLNLSPIALSILLATPVIIGAVGRVPLGLLTDRFGGRKLFAFAAAFASLPVAALAFTGTYYQIIAAAFCLGVAGATFAIGIPFVNAWFPLKQRGLALGIYGMGNIGSALSGLLTPRMVEHLGTTTAFLILSALLLLGSVVMLVWGRDAPGWTRSDESVLTKLRGAIGWQPIGHVSLLYAVTFGAFVSFGIYLPVILVSVYGLSIADAAARAAGFVIFATVMRPAGGWLGDRFGGFTVLKYVFSALLTLALIAALQPPLMPYGTIAYLCLATVLGIGNGAIFALIGHNCEAKHLGTVSGIVGAAGGLGGFFPPLVLGVSYQLFHSFTLALLLLAATCGAILWGLLFSFEPLRVLDKNYKRSAPAASKA